MFVVEQLTVGQVASEQADGVLLVVLVLVLLWIVVVELQAAHVPTIVKVVVEEKKGLAENPTSWS